jgi:hypothetical protein
MDEERSVSYSASLKRILIILALSLAFSSGHALIVGLLAEQIALWASRFQVRIIRSVSDLPEIFSGQWKPGDYLISDGKSLVLMGGTDRVLGSYYQYPIEHTLGSVLGFVPAGRGLRNDLVIGAPYIRIKKRSRYLAYSSFHQEPQKDSAGSLSFLAAADYQGEKNEKVAIRTRYRFSPGSGEIEIVSTVRNTGPTSIADFHFALYVNPDQIYSFSPFEGEDKTKPPFWVYPKDGHYLGWVELNPTKEIYQPIERESLSADLKPGQSIEAHYVLLADVRPDDLLQKIYLHLGMESEKASLSFSGRDGNLMEVVVQDAASSVFFRNFLKEPVPLDMALPEGFYKVRASFFPAVVEKTLIVERGKANHCPIEAPPCEKVKVSIRDRQGRFVPGKVTFIGLGSTKSPYFKPENPIETKTTWESIKNSRFPQKDGQEVELPVGTYLVSASRGPEYTLDQKVIEVVKGGRQELAMRVDRVIHLNNLISVDPHLHTLHSDGAVTIPERIKSIVAEGVDVAISTDHNYLSDFPSALKELGLEEYTAAMVGEEVSSLDRSQNYLPEFNRYPLAIGKNEPGNGALEIGFSDGDAPLFAASRGKDPGSLIQVNHPDYDSFAYYQLDRDSASHVLKSFDLSFDLLEVMNGPFFGSGNSAVIEDWLHFLNRGYYFPIVGSSDSHEIDGDEPGYSRTYVSYEHKTSGGLDEKALLNALKKGRSFVSNGPLVEFKINGKYSSGDTFTAKNRKADIWIRVESAPWVSVDEVRIIINGERKIVIPAEIRPEDIVKLEDNRRLELKRDSYIVIEVAGKRSLYPVVQKKYLIDGSETGPLPYALTNPVFIDVDGNGRFDPPWPEKIKFLNPVED